MELVADNNPLVGQWRVRPYAEEVKNAPARTMKGVKRHAFPKLSGMIELREGGTETERVAMVALDAIRCIGRDVSVTVDVWLGYLRRARVQVLEDGRVVVRFMVGSAIFASKPCYGIVVRNDRRVPDLYVRNDMEV